MRLLARRELRDSRIRTAVFVYLFAVYSFVQPVGYRHSFPDRASRLRFADSFAVNKGLRLLYGQPHDVSTVPGYAAWRVGGVLALAAAAFGVLAAVRALRAQEESGRLEVILAGPVARGGAYWGSVAAVAVGAGLLWAAEFLGLVAGGVPVTGAAYLALATVSVAAVFAGVGALASQLAPTGRGALGLGFAVLALLFAVRVLADTVPGLAGLRWATPLGWAELLRPFAAPRPLVLLLPLAATAALLWASARLASRRDLGTGLLPRRDSAPARRFLLASPTAQALRTQLGAVATWVAAMAVLMFILGVVSRSISPSDIPQGTQDEIAKLGTGSIATPAGYLAFLFLFVVVAVSACACAQVGAAREEELDQRLETLLAQPVRRSRWLAGRLALAVAVLAVLALTAGFFAWTGAIVGGVRISLPRMLEAGANSLPTAVLFLGLAALAYALAPRAGSGLAYGGLVVAFGWQLVASLLGPPQWVVDLSPFAHVGLVPAQPFRPVAAVILAAVGVAAAAAATTLFGRRDLASR
ncbi:polyketide antibiotic transporter [Pseudofrankia inefficax]|nr:polyketide antibiotic transporter [Pseudofrankia inefficax]